MNFLQKGARWGLQPKYKLAPIPCYNMCICGTDDESVSQTTMQSAVQQSHCSDSQSHEYWDSEWIVDKMEFLEWWVLICACLGSYAIQLGW